MHNMGSPEITPTDHIVELGGSTNNQWIVSPRGKTAIKSYKPKLQHPELQKRGPTRLRKAVTAAIARLRKATATLKAEIAATRKETTAAPPDDGTTVPNGDDDDDDDKETKTAAKELLKAAAARLEAAAEVAVAEAEANQNPNHFRKLMSEYSSITTLT
jgi:hypothetical protein